MRAIFLHLLYFGVLLANAENPAFPEERSGKDIRSAISAAKNGIVDASQIDFDTSDGEIDVSMMETVQLWNTVLYSTPPYDPSRELEELIRREIEAREFIESTLNKDELGVEEFARIPHVAAAIATDYGYDVTERLIFHPSATRYDGWFLNGPGGILNHLANKDRDKEWVIDRLVREGRLQAGSELERKWRNKLTRSAKNALSRDSGRPGGRGDSGPAETDENEMMKNGGPAVSWWMPGILLAICIVVMCVIIGRWKNG